MTPKRVVIIGTDYPDLEKYCPNWIGMQRGMERLGIPYKFVSCRPSLDVQGVIDYQPDLVIYGLKDMIMRPQWRREIRAGLPDAKIVIWYGDLRNEQTTQTDADCSEIDAMFISNDAQEQFYKMKWRVPKVHFLPLACEPIPGAKRNNLYRFPFVFIGGQVTGSAFIHRASLIGRFKNEGNLTIINSFESPMRMKIFRAMPEIYSSSKVCLDISHFTDIKGYTSIRFWEIPAFWGFALTKRWPGCEEFYPEDTRVYFDTFEEAIEKKDFYVQHDTLRQKMVAKAHKLSYRHTYKERFLQMFQLL